MNQNIRPKGAGLTWLVEVSWVDDLSQMRGSCLVVPMQTCVAILGGDERTQIYYSMLHPVSAHRSAVSQLTNPLR